MFAPLVAKPKAKTAATSNGKSALQLASVTGPGAQEMESDIASTATQAAAPTWNFSKIPLYPPERMGGVQPPSLLPAPSLPRPIQAKLKVGAVNDPLEHEADRVAEQVMRMPAPEVALTSAPRQVSRKCAACENEEKLQKRPAGAAEAAASEAPPIVHEVLRSPGQPLDAATLTYFEPRFGYDFSKVRIHSDSRAAASAYAVNALAYTAVSTWCSGQGRTDLRRTRDVSFSPMS